MPDGVNIPGGPSFIGLPQPPDVPCDPTGDGWRGPPGPTGPQGTTALIQVQDTPPTYPQPGQLWFDSANPQLYIWYADPTSAQWVIATAYAGGLTTDAPSDGQTYGRQNGAWLNIATGGGYLPITGATPMTGPITLSGNATLPLHAVPLQQVATVPVTATGGTASRTLAARAADLINVMDFTGSDNTGATNSQAGIAAAIAYAATFTPPRGIFFPAGIYSLDSRLVLVNGVDFFANPGTVTIRASAANAGGGGLIFGTTTNVGISDFTCYGIQFDAPNTTNMQLMANLGPPISQVTFDTCVFRDMINPCLSFSGGTTLLSLNLSGTNAAGSTTLTFSAGAVPSWVVAGTPLLGSGLFRGCRVVSSTGTVVTINAPLINTASAVSGLGTVSFVPTKLTNAVSPGGVPTIFMDTTTAVIPKVGDIVSHTSVVYGSKITAVASTSITLDQPLQADIPSGDAVSYIAGANRVTVRGCQFYNIGNKGLNNGTVALTTTTLANSGTSVLTVASTAGVWVGTAKVTGTPPTGVTLNDPVRATTQTTITLTTPLTANLPSGSVVMFVTYGVISDTAIAVFFTNGAPFANYDNVVEDCTFERIGQVAIEASYQQNFTASGNRMSLGLQQWRAGATGAAGAGGGAFYFIRNNGVRLINNDIDGSVASGIDSASNTDIQYIGNTIRRCGACGISVGATDGGVIIGNKISNCYQSSGWYDMANLSHAAGIQFAGTSTGVAGVCQNITVSGNTIMDTQTTPTMPFGIGLLGNTTLTNVAIDSNNIVAGMPTYSPVGGPGGFYLSMLGNTSSTRRLLNLPVASVGNGADLTEDTLQSFTIPAAQLKNVGDVIRVKCGGTMGATTDVKAARVRMAGSNVAQVTSAVAGGTSWAIEVDVQKTGASTQILSGYGLAQSTVVTALSAATVLTDTGTMALTVTGQNTTNSVAGSITCRYLTVEYLPA